MNSVKWVLFGIGAFLLVLNGIGLFKSLRNDEIYTLEHELRNRKNDVVIRYPEIKSRLVRQEGESEQDFSVRVNSVIHDGYSHYWKKEGIDRFNMRVPAWENYLLYVASFVNPKKYERYEFSDYKKNLERGVGVCSGHSIVLKGVLNDHGIKAELLDVGGRHVVVRAEYADHSAYLLDPDYGIHIPHDTAAVTANPELARGPYLNMADLYYEDAKEPYTTDFLVEIFGRHKHTYTVNNKFEHFSYVAIWVIPFLLMLPLVLFRKRRSNRAAIVALAIVSAGLSGCGKEVRSLDADRELSRALTQYASLLAAHPDTTQTPHSVHPDGTYHDKPSDWWGSGFFAGSLWYLYEYSRDQKWKDAAHLWSMAVAGEQYNTTTHDLGFMVFCPFGNGFRLTGDSTYLPILMQGAKSLATRFDPQRGVIKSWDSFRDYEFPVIVDNMMNLDFLFWATEFSGDRSFYDLSVRHADATMQHHFRPDFSSYHVVCYGDTGEVLAQVTHQGYSDSSAWARGQAWALYGYVVMYRETKDEKYLQQATAIADFYLNHPNLPEDKIPYWDFNAPQIPNEERDASAAAIVSSALLELQTYVDGKRADRYTAAARGMLTSLSNAPYRTAEGEAGDFLLKHSVGHKPGGIEVDVPLVYADYYYIEGLLRYRNM